MNSCTAEEILNYTQGATATTSTSSTSTTMDTTATTNSSSIADPGLEPVVPKPK